MRITYIIIIAILAWYANGLRVDNISKNEQLDKAISINVYNDLDKKYRDALCDNDNLRTANDALLRYSEPKSVIKAIKYTPLPKVK